MCASDRCSIRLIVSSGHGSVAVVPDLRRLLPRVGGARGAEPAPEPALPHRDARVDLRVRGAARRLGTVLPRVRAAPAAPAPAPLRRRALAREPGLGAPAQLLRAREAPPVR